MKNGIFALVLSLLSWHLLGCAAISSTTTTSNPEVSQTAQSQQKSPAQPGTPSANEKTTANAKSPDSLLSFTGDMPSPQWFFNDVKIQDA